MSDGVPIRNFGISSELWAANQDLASAALFHPFVEALAQGVLPKPAFQKYIAEDAYFLRSFVRGYEAAAAKVDKAGVAPSKAAAATSQLEQLREGVLEELEMHDSYAAKWGVGLSSQTNQSPHPATSKYINFLFSICDDQHSTVAEVLAALVPCLRLYAYLGCILARSIPESEEYAYAEWIQTYKCQAYIRLPAIAELLLNELALHDSAEKLHQIYRSAMNLEVEFFSSQPYTPPDRPINLLVVDFDDTCTSEDTTSMIARAAITAASKKGADPATAFAQGEEKLHWLVQNYLARRGNLLDEILPEPPLEDELEEFDMAWLGDFLDRISEFDREMNSVVIESKILSGVKKGALTEVGASVPLRPGCLSLLKHAVDSGVPTVVVSVNWSGEMVAAALSQQGLPVVLAGGAGGTRAGVEGAPPPLGAVVVYCNELEYFGDVSTGGMKRRCECAADKGRVFDDLLLGIAAEGHAAEGGVSVYIGDSMTDLSALISADVGIVMGSNQLVRQVASAAGVAIRHLAAYPIDRNATKESLDNGGVKQEDVFASSGMYDEVPILYEAMTWDDIRAFLFGPSFKRQLLRKQTSQELAALASGLKAHIHPPRVLSIAGSDSGGGAGIQADIKACAAAGVFAATAVTALTAQNTQGVSQIHSAPADFIRSQIRAVLEDIGADSIKTGMLPSIEVVEAVADELSSRGTFPALIVDPVLVATSGDVLAEAGVAQALTGRLFPLAMLVTPNVHEASVLLGGRTIADVAGMKLAAQDLHALGPQWVLVKGGHLPLDAIADGEGLSGHSAGGGEGGGNGAGAPQLQASTGFAGAAAEVVVDVLYDGTNFYEMRAPYIQTHNSHGTGCTLAAYIAAEMAKGSDIPSAVRASKKYVWRALERSVGLPLGSGPQRPMNHSYRTADWRTDLEKQQKEQQIINAVPSGTEDSSSSTRNIDSGTIEVASQQQQTSAPPRRVPNVVDLRLYAVTDPLMIDSSGLSVPEAVSAAIKGGATVIQLREKNCGGKEFTARAAAALAQCRAAGVALIINDRVDVALAIGADGVHVGQDDIPAEAVRKVLGPDCILGVSVKTEEEALAAEAAGADYLGAGAIFSTSTKDSSVIGLEGFEEVCRAVSIPVVAIGGVGKTAVKDVVSVGAAGIAVVSAVFATGQGSDCVTQAAGELRQLVDEAFKEHHRK